MSSIDCAHKALKAIKELSDLFKSGEITEVDFENFRSEIEPYITISEQIALEKNIKISNVIEFLKLAISNHYVKSKSSDVLQLKRLMGEAIGKLSVNTHHESQSPRISTTSK